MSFSNSNASPFLDPDACHGWFGSNEETQDHGIQQVTNLRSDCQCSEIRLYRIRFRRLAAKADPDEGSKRQANPLQTGSDSDAESPIMCSKQRGALRCNCSRGSSGFTIFYIIHQGHEGWGYTQLNDITLLRYSGSTSKMSFRCPI